jgi:hypothetical protein
MKDIIAKIGWADTILYSILGFAFGVVVTLPLCLFILESFGLASNVTLDSTNGIILLSFIAIFSVLSSSRIILNFVAKHHPSRKLENETDKMFPKKLQQAGVGYVVLSLLFLGCLFIFSHPEFSLFYILRVILFILFLIYGQMTVIVARSMEKNDLSNLQRTIKRRELCMYGVGLCIFLLFMSFPDKYYSQMPQALLILSTLSGHMILVNRRIRSFYGKYTTATRRGN